MYMYIHGGRVPLGGTIGLSGSSSLEGEGMDGDVAEMNSEDFGNCCTPH